MLLEIVNEVHTIYIHVSKYVSRYVLYSEQLLVPHCSLLYCIGADFGGIPGTFPPIIEKRPCIYHFLPPFSPNILVCPNNIFDKSTPVFYCIVSLHLYSASCNVQLHINQKRAI